MYSGVAKAGIHSRESMIQSLLLLTNRLLTKINAATLYEQEQITDAEKIQLELILNARKLKLKQGYPGDTSKGGEKFTAILHEWFEDEKAFVNELIPIVKNAKQPMGEENIRQHSALYEIWLPDKKGNRELHYQRYIEHLKTYCEQINSSFVTEINGQLHWNKTPQRGWVQYLAAFYHICIRRKWIANSYSSQEIKIILEKTFNVIFNAEPFKQIAVSPPPEKYLSPFLGLHANI